MYKVENGPIAHYLTLMSWGDTFIKKIDPINGTTLYFKLISKAADTTVVVLPNFLSIFSRYESDFEKAPLLNTYFFRVACNSKIVRCDMFYNSSCCPFGFSCAFQSWTLWEFKTPDPIFDLLLVLKVVSETRKWRSSWLLCHEYLALENLREVMNAITLISARVGLQKNILSLRELVTIIFKQ